LGAWWLQAVILSPHGPQWSILPATQKLLFIGFFPINFNSTALFKNAFLVLDLAGNPFGGDVAQLSPCKMKKMSPIARLASGVSTGGCKPQPLPPGPQWSILPGT